MTKGMLVTHTVNHEHSPEAIRERLRAGPRQSYLRDWVYGGIDGAVTTFAVVSGVVGAGLAPGVILVVGTANIIADGFSMAASNYLGTKTETEEREFLRAVEHRHIDADPEGEREEVRQIFGMKGYEGADLERVVELITSDRARWVSTMLAEEYGLAPEARSAWRAAAATFSAFMLCGAAPLAPFVLGAPHAFALSALLTGAAFFAVGSAKGLWSPEAWWRSGLTTLCVGAAAALLAYAVGVLTKGLL